MDSGIRAARPGPRIGRASFLSRSDRHPLLDGEAGHDKDIPSSESARHPSRPVLDDEVPTVNMHGPPPPPPPLSALPAPR